MSFGADVYGRSTIVDQDGNPLPLSGNLGIRVYAIFDSGSAQSPIPVTFASGAISIGNISGSFTVARPGTSFLYEIPAQDTPGPIVLASGNLGRMAITIFNDSPGTMYVRLGPGAATNAFSFKLKQQDFYDAEDPCFTGEITAVWRDSNASGTAYVTEMTP